MVSSLPQQSQDEIRAALELTARRVSMELTGVTLEFTMSRAFVIVYDAARQKGLKKHTARPRRAAKNARDAASASRPAPPNRRTDGRRARRSSCSSPNRTGTSRAAGRASSRACWSRPSTPSPVSARPSSSRRTRSSTKGYPSSAEDVRPVGVPARALRAAPRAPTAGLLVCVFATKKRARRVPFARRARSNPPPLGRKIGGGALGPEDSIKAIDTIQPAKSTSEKGSSHKSKYGSMMNEDQVLSQECACTIS